MNHFKPWTGDLTTTTTIDGRAYAPAGTLAVELGATLITLDPLLTFAPAGRNEIVAIPSALVAGVIYADVEAAVLACRPTPAR